MAGKEPKMVTVIIKVDLGCRCCAKKIKSALCKLEKQFKISSIAFDDKKNTITVSGAFNPDCFIKKIRCMACKVIICIEIQDDKPSKPPAPPPPQPEVKVNVSICCCWPCPCYQPHLGCNRCCSCGYESSCPPTKPSCSGGHVPSCPPTKPSCSGGHVPSCPPTKPSCSGGHVPSCPPSQPWCSSGHVSSCPPSKPPCSGGYPCYKIVCEEEPSYGCSIM